MRPVLQNQPQIGHLGQFLLDALRSLVASIQTGWNKEHDGDGAHTAVTAESVTVATDLSALGKVRLAGIVSYTAPGIIASGRMDNVTVPGIATAGVLKIRNTAAAITLTGIDATGRRVGDLLLLVNDDLVVADPTDFALAAADTNSLEPNRFIGGVASGSPWTLQGSEAVLLMYDSYTNTGQSVAYGWRVISGV